MSLAGKELGKALRNLQVAWKQGMCLHPDAPKGCSGPPIGSHTIQRSKILRSIAVDGHVRRIHVDTAALLKQELENDSNISKIWAIFSTFYEQHNLEPLKIGIAQASVFPGFCSHHDKHTFVPIEDIDLVFDDY